VKRRVLTVLSAALATAALVAPAGAGAGEGLTAVKAGEGPTAVKSGEELVRYLTKGRLKPARRIEYRVVCGADCSVTATSTLVLKGPNLGPVSSSGQFPAGGIAEVFLKPNKPARAAIKASGNAAKLVTKVRATNVLTGEVDVDSRTFRFK
jgi:hypothetical protein